MSKSRELKTLLDPIHDSHELLYVIGAKITLGLQYHPGKCGTLLSDLFSYTRLLYLYTPIVITVFWYALDSLS